VWICGAEKGCNAIVAYLCGKVFSFSSGNKLRMFPSPAQDRPCSVNVVGRELLPDDLVQILGFGREDLASWYWIQYSLLR
jgi:hypothetical protein